MKFVTPSAHLVAFTQIDEGAMAEMLHALGAPEDWRTDAPSDSEELIETMGRLCYKSFGTDMNANITRTREGNEGYVGNILSVKHGSVLEHSYATFGFVDVSPVVTHELVRHRVGTAFSQVSMRFVRLTEIGTYYPQAFETKFLTELFTAQDDPFPQEKAEVAHGELQQMWVELVEMMEKFQVETAERLGLDEIPQENKRAFHLKKRITSSMRRLAPYGLSTSIGVTANHRAWRFMVAQRTHRSAEEEIRLVFGQVAETLANRFPNLYQDMQSQFVDGFNEYTFDNHKV